MALGVSLPLGAQTLPSEPIVFGDGRITISGDASAAYACTSAPDPATPMRCADDAGFFNYTDYEHSALRMWRFDVTTVVRANDRVSLLSDIRSENGRSPRPYGLYVRVRPWASRAIDIQAGRVPPTFGAFARRAYSSDNFLIAYPLGYQYLTSLRPDSLPADADELLRMRGRGWLSSFSLGSTEPENGMSIANAFRWDTGVQVHAESGPLDATASVTTGSLANPLFADDNDGKQIAMRIGVRPATGLIVGASASRAPFVSNSALQTLPADLRSGSYTQTAFGADVEYSRDYYLVRAETIVSDWRVPLAGAPHITLPLRAVAGAIEGRYKLRPAFYVAARVDAMGFSRITGTARTAEWDAPLSRIEVGGGYSIQRNLQVRLSVQHDERDGGRVRRSTITATQVLFWF
jgi:hypothetical protein